jgi:hypothetical protein
VPKPGPGNVALGGGSQSRVEMGDGPRRDVGGAGVANRARPSETRGRAVGESERAEEDGDAGPRPEHRTVTLRCNHRFNERMKLR